MVEHPLNSDIVHAPANQNAKIIDLVVASTVSLSW